MKYDEKTGKKLPEGRMEEVSVSHEELGKLMKGLGGAGDRAVEIAWVLRDINISLGLLVDMMSVMLNRLCRDGQELPFADGSVPEGADNDECP